MNLKSIGFIGGGRVTEFLLIRLNEVGILPERVIVSDPNDDRRPVLTKINPDKISYTMNNTEAADSDLVVLAVHPQNMHDVCTQSAPHLTPDSIVLSLTPTVTIKTLEKKLRGFNRIVRMIPNAPSVIGKGYNPVVYSKNLTGEDRSFLLNLFRHWGDSPEVSEELLEAYAILTGMGPTYFWFQWLELVRMGVQFGLSDTESRRAAAAMLHGAVDTLFHSGLSEKQVLDLIPSYPLKKNEEEIRRIFSERLSGMWNQLREATHEN